MSKDMTGDLSALNAAVAARAATDSALEREAIALYQSIPGFARTAALRDFLRRMADYLNWNNLKVILK
jgi:hypothetical protein